MTPEQLAAFNNSLSPSFTEDEAKLVLDWHYGDRKAMFMTANSVPCVGVCAAISKLGGKTQAGWGITVFPKWREDEVNTDPFFQNIKRG